MKSLVKTEMETTFCRAREGSWNDISIRTLDNEEGWGVFNTDLSEWAICVATCSDTGVSVITDNYDQYFLVQSIDLDYATSIQALGALERGGV